MISGPPMVADESLRWSGDYVAEAAALVPDRTAIITPDRGGELTYAELHRRICRTVHMFGELGIKPGDRVAFLGRNSDMNYILLIAAMRSGVIFAPLNWRCQTDEIAYFLSDSASGHLFVDDDFAEVARNACANIETSPTLLSTYEGGVFDDSFARAIADEGPITEDAVERGPTPSLLLYTSGTSGRPKGVVSSHLAFSLMRHAEVISPIFPEWSDETMVSGMPGFHIAGLTWMMVGFQRRSTCVLTADASAANLSRLIREHGAIRTFAVPTVIRDIVELVRSSGEPLPTLKMFLYGAMPIGESLLRDAMDTLGCSFGQFYGMTEVTGSATFLAEWNHSLEKPELMQSVGEPFPGVDIDIRDPDGNSLPAGVPGEIFIRTPTMMNEYWRRPEDTAAVLQDGWYRTGDGGKLDEEGFLYLTDRIKDMIISGGENIYPAEVEEILSRHPAVQASVAVPRPHPRWGEAVASLVELRPGASATEDEIIAFCRERLAAYKCPKSVHFVTNLPRTASGKLQRAKAKADFHEQLAAEA